MLTHEQQHLLHTWVDGETQDAEGHIAAELASRPEAAAYVADTRRVRELIARYGNVKAPAGLEPSVRAAIARDRGAPVFQLHAWRAAVLAAAAAVVIVLGLTLGPALLSTDTIQYTEPETAFVTPGAAPVSAENSLPLNAKGRQEGEKKDKHTDTRLVADATKTKAPASAILNMDRGKDQPFELTVHMDRSRTASNLQVYNDMLIVGSLYGDAELRDSNVQGRNEEAEFTGRDFSEFDGVLVEVEVDRVPELIAAIDRMTDDQRYGTVVIPGDLRRSIESNSAEVDQLQVFSRKLARAHDDNKDGGATLGGGSPGARNYLPSEVQRECLKFELKGLPPELEGLNADLDGQMHSPATVTAGKTTSHKVKLVLRLR